MSAQPAPLPRPGALAPSVLPIDATTDLLRAACIGAVAICIVAILIGAALLLRTEPSVGGKRAFMGACLALLIAASAAGVAIILAVPARLWYAVELVFRQDWMRNNFEFALITAGVAAATAASLILRAWASIETDTTLRAERMETAIRSSVVTACALGVSILVALAASAFSASLWQRDIAAAVSDQSRVSLARIQSTVDRLSHLSDQMAETDRAIDRFQERGRTLTLRAQLLVARGDRLRAEAAIAGASPELAAGMIWDAARARAEAEELVQLAGVMDVRARELSRIHDALEVRRDCNIFQVAQLIEDNYWTDYRPTAPQPSPGATAQCRPGEKKVKIESWTAATRLIDTVQTLARSWMSSQMAKRAPTTLSLELILLMGALGALLEATSRALFPPSRRAAKPRLSDRTLVSLALTIVFGMSTAFVLFVLMNATLSTAVNQPIQDVSAADYFNPFTLALVGVAGGYSSHQVVTWLSRLVRGWNDDNKDAKAPADKEKIDGEEATTSTDEAKA